MRKLIVITLFLLTNLLNAQIRIMDVGDGWKTKVEMALEVVKNYDEEKYQQINNHCDEIGYWNGQFSTTEDGNKIILSRKEMDNNSINNIACAIVHESRHLMLEKSESKWDENFQEFMCYDYELNFAKKIPNIEKWLIDHIISMREKYVKIISL